MREMGGGGGDKICFVNFKQKNYLKTIQRANTLSENIQLQENKRKNVLLNTSLKRVLDSMQ